MEKIKKRLASIILIEPIDSSLTMMADILKNSGFSSIKSCRNIKDAVSILEVEDIDWIICPILKEESDNLFKFLKLLLKFLVLHTVKISALVEQSDFEILPQAYEFGIINHFNRLSNPESMKKEFTDFLKKLENETDSVKVASNCLGNFLKFTKNFEEYIELQKSMYARYDKLDYIYSQLEALVALDRKEEAKLLLKIAVSRGANPDEIKIKSITMIGEDIDYSKVSLKENLKTGKVAVLSPDDSLRVEFEKNLNELELSDIISFKESEELWRFLSDEGEVDFIFLDLKVSDVAGVVIVQRIKFSYPSLPILVIDEKVTPEDHLLLKEIGVSNFISVPFTKESLSNSIFQVIQKEILPSGSIDLISQIRKKFDEKDLISADGLLNKYKISPFSTVPEIECIEGEMAYYNKNFEKAKDLFVHSMLSSNEPSIHLINMLAKCFMSLGQFDAALKCLEKAQNFSPRNIARLCMVAESKIAQGDVEGAESTLQEAKSLDNNSDMVKSTEASVAIESGNFDLAKNLLKDTKILKHLVAKQNNKAVSYVKSMQNEKAEELYKQTLESLPEDDQKYRNIVHYNFALYYARQEKIDAAITNMEITSKDSGDLGKKATNLLEKFQRALNNGVKLKFNDSIQDSKVSKASLDLVGITDVGIGKRGLFKLFQAKLQNKELLDKLTKESFHFMLRRS